MYITSLSWINQDVLRNKSAISQLPFLSEPGMLSFGFQPEFFLCFKPLVLNWQKLVLTLQRAGGGGMCPQHFQRLAVLRGMELGVSNLHVNSFFSCKQQVTIMKMGGLYNKFFEKFAFWKKNCCKKWDENFEKLIFFTLFHNKWHLFMSNMNVECFQLSFDVYIVQICHKL